LREIVAHAPQLVAECPVATAESQTYSGSIAQV
jgi:hypothetical protein